MGVGSARRAAAKDQQSPAGRHRSVSRSLKAEDTPSPKTTHGSSKRAKKTPLKEQQSFSHELPTDQQRRSNGRVRGRNLIVWGRPRMAEKLLLHIQYECARHKISLPWDTISHRLHPGSSGGAIVQHLNRLRRELISEGHLVPPLPSRPSSGEPAAVEIRGYIRDDEAGTCDDGTRPVRFDESIDDRKFNLPDSFDTGDGFEEELTDDEAYPSYPESPTPLARAYRKMAPAKHHLSRSFGEAPGAGSPLANAYGSNNHQRSDSTEDDNPIDENILGQAGEKAPYYIHEPRRNVTEEPPPQYPRADDLGHPRVMDMRHGMSAFPMQHALGPLDGFDGYVAPTAVEGGAGSIKNPLDYNHGSPYAFLPWQMGFPMPYAAYHLGHSAIPKNPRQDPFMSFASAPSEAGAVKKEEPQRGESASESETQSGSASVQDLIVSAPGTQEECCQICAHTDVKLESALDD